MRIGSVEVQHRRQSIRGRRREAGRTRLTVTPPLNAAPKRRRFRFSLRTMLVVVTALTCWSGWGAYTLRSATSDLDLLPFVVVSLFIAPPRQHSSDLACYPA